MSNRIFKRFDELGLCNSFIRTVNSTGKTVAKLQCGQHIGKNNLEKLHPSDKYTGFFEERGEDMLAWYCNDCVKSIKDSEKQ